MKILQIVASLVVVINARPDASHLVANTYLPASDDPCDTPETNIEDPFSYQQEEDQKHFYYYASPNDGHYTNYHINVIPKSKKNTKVIFVKAPHHAGVIPKITAPASLAEDRTLVYVLVKKPIKGQSVSIPAGLGIKQLKPEVFFIKYNNKHEAAAQVGSGIQGQPVGTNVPDLPNESAFINTLGNGNGHGYHYDKPTSPVEDTYTTNVVSEKPITKVDIADETFAGLDKDNIPDIPSDDFLKSLGDDDDILNIAGDYNDNSNDDDDPFTIVDLDKKKK